MKMNNYYITFGSSMEFPFQNSYLVIQAKNESKAREIFREHFPDKHIGVLNFAFIYNEDEWLKTSMKDHYPCVGTINENGFLIKKSENPIELEL
jgi:hypothetical protein